MNWRPIETAPEGGPGFLACNENDYTYIEWVVKSDDYALNPDLTHWMPRPDPPTPTSPPIQPESAGSKS